MIENPQLYSIKLVKYIPGNNIWIVIIAVETGTELVKGICYKLGMMWLLLHGEASIYCNKERYINNNLMLDSFLNKKHKFICYHNFKELCACTIIWIAFEIENTNPDDVFVNITPGTRNKYLAKVILHWGFVYNK